MSDGHQWGRPAVVPRPVFSVYANEARALREALGFPRSGSNTGVRIGHMQGRGWPRFTDDLVLFNGSPPQDPLLIHRVFHRRERPAQAFGLFWDAVQTNAEPYGALVVAVLISLKHHVPAAALAIDEASADWATGIALYERTTDRTAPDLKELATPRYERPRRGGRWGA